jgi:8-oxo-dGTP pyrophosphatase MutT (NUDIX family)
MLKDRFKVTPAVHLILIQEGNVLLLRRFNTGYEDGNYSVPAGHLDGHEPVSAAMVREVWEETGMLIDSHDLRVIHVMHRNISESRLAPQERVDFFLSAERWCGKPQIMEPTKCDELAWYPVVNLPSNVVPYVRAALTAYLSGQYYSEFGWQPTYARV